jgi:rhodanese-related sulfurtransferase
MVPELTAPQLAEKLKSGNPLLLIDVREADEYAYCRLKSGQLKPLGDIMQWAKDLDPKAETVCYCHTGQRSYVAAGYLQQLGFKNVFNLAGGIDEWSVLVDPQVPRY